MHRWPLLLVAALLLLAGSARAVMVEGLDLLAVALLSAGLLVLGVWVRDEVGSK